jgi:hypothetical protein
MKKYLEKIGSNAKIAFEKKISNKKKNKVLNYYTQLIIKTLLAILSENADEKKLLNPKNLKKI